jgi:hypothetical protein
VLTCAVGSLGANARRNLLLTVVPTATTIGIASARATVTTTTFELETGNNADAGDAIEVFYQRPSIPFSIASLLTSFQDGRIVSFTVSNLSAHGATNIEIEGRLESGDDMSWHMPAGCVAYSTSIFAGFGNAGPPNAYRCTLGLAAGQSRTLNFEARHSEPEHGEITIRIEEATVSGVRAVVTGVTQARVVLPWNP